MQSVKRIKTARFMLAQARKAGLALPVTEAVEKLMAKSYNNGYGYSDLSVVLETLESAEITAMGKRLQRWELKKI